MCARSTSGEFSVRAAEAATRRSETPRSQTSDDEGTCKPAPGLYLVATPIGNLGDVTLRARDVLAGADVIACEDTRVTGKLLNALHIERPMTPYHDHNAASARPKLLARLAAGETVALVSDAGTPLISDPGYKLVQAAIEAGHAVVPIPGASAVLAALAGAGLPTDRFLFYGFLPQKVAARRTAIASLATVPATLIFFESAKRLPAVLQDLSAGLGDRLAAVARELTKLHEEFRRDSLAALTEHYAAAGPPKGEVVIVVAPPGEESAADSDTVDQLLRAALADLSTRDAADRVAAETGWARRTVYGRALALKKNDAS